MYSNRTLPSAGEKRPSDKQQSFIQRFYIFNQHRSTDPSTPPTSPSSDRYPSLKKQRRKPPDDCEDDQQQQPGQQPGQQHYSVQRLKQFWNNRLSLSASGGGGQSTSEATLSRKLKSLTLGSSTPSRTPATPEFLRRNGSARGSASRRNIVRNSLVPLYSSQAKGKEKKSESETTLLAPKRTSLALSPINDQKLEKRTCVERIGSCNAGFPLVTTTPNGGRISWAKRAELLEIRALSSNGSEVKRDQSKMPMKGENYVSSFIDVDIVPLGKEEETASTPTTFKRDSLESKKSLSPSESHSLGKRHSTPTKKVSFRTTTSPYNRKLLYPNGNKVAALTNKFNKLIQQDAGILEEVRKRGGYLHKAGGHVYKVIDGDGSGSLRKKSERTEEDDASVGSKGSWRKAGVRKRPSLRKNLYRKPDWELSRDSSCVKKALEVFEPNQSHKSEVKHASGVKPKVPDKSEHVIQKTKELKCKKPIQIEAKSCDSNTEEKVLDEVPNSISEVSINDNDKNEELNDTPVAEEIVEYSEVKKKSASEEAVARSSPDNNKMIDEADNISMRSSEASQKTPPPKQKSTVQKIYERIMFRSIKKINFGSPERTASESQLSTSSEAGGLFSSNSWLPRKSFVSSIEIPTIRIEKSSESMPTSSDRKIVDAIRSLDEKIDNLSRNFNELSLNDLGHDSDAEPMVQPNNSFLFRSMSKLGSENETTVSQQNLAQAVNTVVINKSVSMDDHHFPCRTNLDRLSFNEKVPVVILSKPTKEIENDYELVSRMTSPDTSDNCSTKSSTMSFDIAELTSKIETFVYKAKHSENIYQSLTAPVNVNSIRPEQIEIDALSVNSYESFENYESIERSSNPSPKEEDTYEICNPPEPLPPRNEVKQHCSSPNDLAIPQPKRNLAGSPKFLPKHAPNYSLNYERIKYDKTPPRPPKPEQVPLPPRNNVASMERSPRVPSISPTLSEEPIYEENIYDTIKSMDYDDPTGSAEAALTNLHKADSISIVSSNCYESIGSKLAVDYLRHGAVTLPRMGSISTLASDQITNSLYGCHTEAQSLTPPSERGSDTSNNSAEWTDISDDEDDEGSDSRRSNFIIVRKRNKSHQMPVWSRKVRHKLVSQQQLEEKSELDPLNDDSDHVYESLDSHAQQQQQQQQQQKPSVGSGKYVPSRRVPPPPPPAIPGELRAESKPVTDENIPPNDEEFDSFDSDNESDEDLHRKHDSGVDISNAKLPDPPPGSGQVYALMQKIKSLGTLSKSEITKGLHKLSKKKPISPKSPKIANGEGPNAASTGPEDSPNYENTPLPRVPKTKSKSFKLPLQLGAKVSDDYENTEFHTPVTPNSSSPNSSALASSPASEQADKSLLASISNSDSSNVATIRKKTKNGKSLRSKLRKSLQSDSSLNIGSSFNGSRSTFYVVDTLDVDSGIFNGSEPNSSSSNLNVASVEKDTPVETILKTTQQNTPEADRRKSALGSPANRPTNPPPPPPAGGAAGGDKKYLKSRKLGATSWYAECGVFKSESLKQASLDNELKNKERSTTSWYAEVGLYQTSGVSVASSSESSGVSTGGEGGPGDDHSHSMFVNEPLYQIYNAAKLESLTRDIDAEITGDTELYDDGYEKISDQGKNGDAGSLVDEEIGRKLRPTAFELIEPNLGKLRTLWCEIPEVIHSEILLSLTPTEKRLQEAKFEILTSEASYLKSLNLLRSHFINHPAFRDVKVLSSAERKTLFSNIIPVQECSDRLLCDLENCWQDNIMLLGLSHSICKHAERHFHVYVKYCEHQAKIDRMLKNLKATRCEFSKTLAELESDPVCCGLSLFSFLMLPMQRITRMRLLLDAVLQRLKPNDDEFESWERTFVLINRILTQCNDAAHRSEQMHEMETISRQIEFPTNIRPLAIVPCGIGPPGSVMRKLEKRSELAHILWRGDDAKLTFGKKFTKSNIYAFLFTDLLVLTKKKSDDTYLVTDYCPRALLTVSSGDVVPQLPIKEMQAIGKNLIIMTLLENHEGKTVEMILSCPSETERERWLKATEPLASENPDEKIYEQWDCPQVIAVHPYQALQPDELGLDIKDVVNVHRKMADGWYEGERIRDGAVGWFPSNYTKEIFSAHVRAKHIKQRHMLLSYTSKYIDTTTRTLQHSKK